MGHILIKKTKDGEMVLSEEALASSCDLAEQLVSQIIIPEDQEETTLALGMKASMATMAIMMQMMLFHPDEFEDMLQQTLGDSGVHVFGADTKEELEKQVNDHMKGLYS